MNYFISVCKAKLRNVKDVTRNEKSESEDEDLYVSSIVKVEELSKTGKAIWNKTVEAMGKQ